MLVPSNDQTPSFALGRLNCRFLKYFAEVSLYPCTAYSFWGSVLVFFFSFSLRDWIPGKVILPRVAILTLTDTQD